MAKEAPKTTPPAFDGEPIENILGRLSTLVETVEDMGKEERAAALVYLKSRYRADWPSDSNY